MIYIFLLGRVLLGVYLAWSGYKHFKHLANVSGYAASKGVPMAKLATIFTGLLLLICGLGILLGVFVKFALLCGIIFFAGVTFKMHAYWKIQDPMQKMGERINFEKNLGLLGALLMLYMIPLPWVLSLF